MEWLSIIFRLHKLPTKIIFLLFLLSLTLLLMPVLMPEKALDALQLQRLLQNYGMYIGPVCLGLGIFLLINLSIFLWQRFKIRRSRVDARKTIEKLVNDWNQLLNSAGNLKTNTYTVEEPTDRNSFEVSIGQEGLYRQVEVYTFHPSCPVLLNFNRLKTHTITEIESLIKNLPALGNYLEEIKDVTLSGDFPSRNETIEHAKNQMIFIRDIFE